MAGGWDKSVLVGAKALSYKGHWQSEGPGRGLLYSIHVKQKQKGHPRKVQMEI